MKNFLLKIKPYSVFLLFFVMVLLFLPENLSKSSESNRNAIITTVGVDKIDDKFSVSFVSFTPTAGKEFVEVYDIITAEAESLSEVLKKMELAHGKVVEFYHTENIVIGKDAQDDIVDILNYFVKEKTLAYSAVIVGTDGTAKDFLTKLHEKNGNPSILITGLMLYNSEYAYYDKPTIEGFFSGYYSQTSSSFIGNLQLNEEEANSQAQESQGATGNEKSSRKIVKNIGDINLFKKGKMVYKMTPEEVTGLNWFQKNIKDGIIKVEKDGKTKVYHMDNKNLIQKVSIENNQPKYELNLIININKQEDGNEAKEHIEIDRLSTEDKKLIKEAIREQITLSINKLIENKVDIIGVYDKFYREERKAFKKFLDSLQNPDDFLEKVIFEIQIDLLND